MGNLSRAWFAFSLGFSMAAAVLHQGTGQPLARVQAADSKLQVAASDPASVWVPTETGTAALTEAEATARALASAKDPDRGELGFLAGDVFPANSIDDIRLIVHFILSTGADTLTPVKQRMMESVFVHHPDATVVLHVTRKSDVPEFKEKVKPFQERGLDLKVSGYDLEQDCLEKLKHTPGVNQSSLRLFRSNLQEYTKGHAWYSHATDMSRMCILYFEGGVYFDTDVQLVKPFPRSFLGVLAWQDDNEKFTNGAVMQFQKRSPFMLASLNEATRIYYRDAEWGTIGPRLLTHMVRTPELEKYVRVLPRAMFYPVPPNGNSRYILWQGNTSDPDVKSMEALIKEQSFTVHYYFNGLGAGKGCGRSVLGRRLLESTCVFCDRDLF